MKYYLVYLLCGKVVDICRYDIEEAQIKRYQHEQEMLATFSLCFDEVQMFDSVD